MRRTSSVAACLLSCLSVFAVVLAPAARANTYNLVTDFSAAANPNGVWSYLVSGSLFPLSQGYTAVCGTTSGVNCWYNGSPFPYSAAIVQNVSGGTLHPNSTTYVPTNYLQFDPQSLNLEILFTAPSDGSYQIGGQFLGIDVGENSHPVSVVRNGGITLFTELNSFYGQTNRFDVTASLNAGDTVAFEVATGSRGCSSCNLSTGLWAEVTTSTTPIALPAPIFLTLSPEPPVLGPLCCALAGLALARAGLRRTANH